MDSKQLTALDSATNNSNSVRSLPFQTTPTSSGDEVPTDTSYWSSHLVENLGIRKVNKNPFELIRDEWSLCSLNESEVSRIEEIARICSLHRINFDTLEEISIDNRQPYKEWILEWFPKTTVKELKSFNENCEEFGYFLFDMIQQISLSKKDNSRPPYEIEYQVLFEKFLRLFEIKTKGQPYIPTGKAVLFGQETSSKVDILCLKCDDPRQVLCVCEVKGNSIPSDICYFPAKKKMCPSSTMSSEATSSTSCSFDLPQHVGELLVYLDKSVMKKGLLGMVIQKTNVLFTFLKISPESYKRIKESTTPGSLSFDPAKEEEPILYYTDQFNFLKRKDRETLFKVLLAVKFMDEFHRSKT